MGKCNGLWRNHSVVSTVWLKEIGLDPWGLCLQVSHIEALKGKFSHEWNCSHQGMWSGVIWGPAEQQATLPQMSGPQSPHRLILRLPGSCPAYVSSISWSQEWGSSWEPRTVSFCLQVERWYTDRHQAPRHPLQKWLPLQVPFIGKSSVLWCHSQLSTQRSVASCPAASRSPRTCLSWLNTQDTIISRKVHRSPFLARRILLLSWKGSSVVACNSLPISPGNYSQKRPKGLEEKRDLLDKNGGCFKCLRSSLEGPLHAA